MPIDRKAKSQRKNLTPADDSRAQAPRRRMRKGPHPGQNGAYAGVVFSDLPPQFRGLDVEGLLHSICVTTENIVMRYVFSNYEVKPPATYVVAWPKSEYTKKIIQHCLMAVPKILIEGRPIHCRTATQEELDYAISNSSRAPSSLTPKRVNVNLHNTFLTNGNFRITLKRNK